MYEKQFNPNEVAQMLQEEVVERFTWGIYGKEAADKFRRQVDGSLNRREMNKEYIVTISTTVRPPLYRVLHLVHVEKRENVNKDNNED